VTVEIIKALLEAQTGLIGAFINKLHGPAPLKILCITPPHLENISVAPQNLAEADIHSRPLVSAA
jgi:hypothetical protein